MEAAVPAPANGSVGTAAATSPRRAGGDNGKDVLVCCAEDRAAVVVLERGGKSDADSPVRMVAALTMEAVSMEDPCLECKEGDILCNRGGGGGGGCEGGRAR
jgi:hypothetical protein